MRQSILRVLRPLRDLWIYFKTGHGTYLSFLLSMVNFIIIQYQFVISKVPAFNSLLPSIGSFILFFGVTYFPLAVIIGRFEYKLGERKRRPMLNPYSQAILKAEISMLDGHIALAIQLDNPEALERYRYAKEIKSKWKRS